MVVGQVYKSGTGETGMRVYEEWLVVDPSVSIEIESERLVERCTWLEIGQCSKTAYNQRRRRLLTAETKIRILVEKEVFITDHLLRQISESL